ncbi:hypothetical protein [Bradyrhizobium frederickii]|nr:hypothetical protein [Bradyrhizobium frederickii]
MNMWTGAAMLAIAAILVLIGRPNKAGEHPRLLRFSAAMVELVPQI